MPGSSKRLTAAQRKKIRMQYEKSGRRKDPATDLVLAAASAVPVAGVAARGAAAGRAAASAAKASRTKKKSEKNYREAMERIDSQGDGPQPPTTRREQFRESRQMKKNIKNNRKYNAEVRAAKQKYGDDWFRHVSFGGKKRKVKVKRRGR